MKKLVLFAGVLLGVVFSASAQLVVDAEMFKANPNGFMGKTVTIKNVTLKESGSQTLGVVGGSVTVPISGASSSAPVGVAGPSSGKSSTIYCNPQPNFTLSKWNLGPKNDLCVQVDSKMKPMLDACMPGKLVKSLTFRVTPTMYIATRIEP